MKSDDSGKAEWLVFGCILAHLRIGELMTWRLSHVWSLQDSVRVIIRDMRAGLLVEEVQWSPFDPCQWIVDQGLLNQRPHFVL